MVTITREESLPIVKVIIPAGTTVTTSFPQTFFGYLTDVRISNLDPALVATYQINGESSPIITLGANSFVTMGGTRIDLIRIVAPAGGAVQIEGSLMLLS